MSFRVEIQWKPAGADRNRTVGHRSGAVTATLHTQVPVAILLVLKRKEPKESVHLAGKKRNLFVVPAASSSFTLSVAAHSVRDIPVTGWNAPPLPWNK